MVFDKFMPFKTKKHKLAAASRHTINFSESTKVEYSNAGAKLESKKTTEAGMRKSSQTIETSYDFVRSELGKIILLAVLIIGLQIALKLSNLL